MNFDDYLSNYSGYGVTVTIIDTGVMFDKENIIHYKYQNGEIIHCATNASDLIHGTSCADAILHLAPNVKMNDICVYENDVITEKALFAR